MRWRIGLWMVGGALLTVPAPLIAQTPLEQGQAPTPSIQKMLDDALKIKDPAQKTEALKNVLGAAKASNDLEGQAESEDLLGTSAKVADQVSWFEAAIKDYRAAGNRKAGAIALMRLGRTYISLASPGKALECYKQALPIQKDVGDRKSLAKTLASIAYVYNIQGQNQEALDYYKQAIPVFIETGDGQSAGKYLTNIGLIYGNLSQPNRALDYFQQALVVQKRVGDRESMRITLNNIGVVYTNQGQPLKALDYYSQALPIEKEVGDTQMMEKTLTNIGVVYVGLGQLQQALDSFNKALPIEKEAGDKVMESETLGNTGIVYESLGQMQTALDYYNQAMQMQRASGDKASVARNLSNIGVVYSDLEQLQKALDYFNQALPIEKEVGDMQSVGKTLANIGAIYGDMKQPQKALEYYKQVLSLETDVGDTVVVGSTINQIGETYRDMGQLQKALDYFSKALPIIREAGDRSKEAVVLNNTSNLLALKKLPALAIVFAKQSVNTYQDLRKDIRALPRSDQEAYSKVVEPTYRQLADLLIKQGRLREAEKVMNLLKDEENFEFVARSAEPAAGVEDRIEAIGAEAGWWAKYQALQDQALKIDSEEFDLTQKSATLRSGSSLSAAQKADLEKIETRLKELDAQKEVLDKAADAYFDDVGKQASALGESVRKEAEERVRQTGDELPSLLERLHRDSGEKIGAVYALATTDELDFLIVTYAGRAHLSVPIKCEDLNLMISDFRKHLMNPYSDPKPQGEKLYRLVFERLIRQLSQAGCTRVVWCLDGTLRYVPLGALWDGKQYLIERGDYTMFDPLNLDRIPSETSKAVEAAGFAATEGKGEAFAPLPGADKELKAIIMDESQTGFTGAVHGRAFENKGFDQSSLTSAMKAEQFSLLHIATHFNIGKDFNSSDLLLGDGNVLSLKQFTDAGSHGRLGHLDLVCLSACDTAESFGDSVGTGSQFSSFVSLTLKDGASSVVASLWPVSDASTPILMQRFYANWMAHKGQGKAEALRSAQLSLLRGEVTGTAGRSGSVGANSPPGQKEFLPDPKRPFAHPYYWAPFILFGNWK